MNQNFLDSARKQFHYYQGLGQRSMDQLSDEALFYEPVPGINSIAVIVKHLHGNMMSRWTDFLSSDGEKEWRDRDGEFEPTLRNRDEVYAKWQVGWQCVFQALDPLTGADMERIIYIRNGGHTVMEAINRQQCHYAYHVGQMVFLGKIIQGEAWESLSIPKGASQAYNQARFSQTKEKRHFTEDIEHPTG